MCQNYVKVLSGPKQLVSLLSSTRLVYVQDMLVAEMHTPLLCAKQAASVMKGVGGSVVFVANAGDRGLTDGAGNLGAISALTSSAAAAGGPVGIRVNCVSHALGSQDESGGGNGSGGHGTFSLATMREPSAEDVAMQVKVWRMREDVHPARVSYWDTVRGVLIETPCGSTPPLHTARTIPQQSSGRFPPETPLVGVLSRKV